MLLIYSYVSQGHLNCVICSPRYGLATLNKLNPGNAMDIIKELNITEQTETIVLPEMTSEEYQRAKGVLARLDIEWNRQKKTHVLGSKTYIKWVKYIKTGRLPKLNPTAFFPTPYDVVELILTEYFDDSYIEYLQEYHPKSLRVLEPSAGVGAIAKAAKSYFGDAAQCIDTVEYLPENCQALKNEGFTPYNGDFLDYQPDELYDVIVMNPPFAVTGNKFAYMTHVLHALSILKPDGRLVAILPTGWLSQSNKRIDAFKEVAAKYTAWEFAHIFESGAFKSSGTMVETMALCLDKTSPLIKEKEHCGWETPALWHFNVHSDALMTGDIEACRLYGLAMDANNRSQCTKAFTNFFRYAKSELAKKGMFYTEDTCLRIIERMVSYEHHEDVLLDDNEDVFQLATYALTDSLKTEANTQKTRKKKTTKKHLSAASNEMQAEFQW